MLLKFDIIWKNVDHIIRLQNDINFSEMPFLKKMKYQFLWNTLYILNDITLYNKNVLYENCFQSSVIVACK